MEHALASDPPIAEVVEPIGQGVHVAAKGPFHLPKKPTAHALQTLSADPPATYDVVPGGQAAQAEAFFPAEYDPSAQMLQPAALDPGLEGTPL